MAEARAQHNWAAVSSLLAMIANVNRDPKKTRSFVPSDFNPLIERKRKDEPVLQVGIEALKDVFIDGRMPAVLQGNVSCPSSNRNSTSTAAGSADPATA